MRMSLILAFLMSNDSLVNSRLSALFDIGPSLVRKVEKPVPSELLCLWKKVTEERAGVVRANWRPETLRRRSQIVRLAR